MVNNNINIQELTNILEKSYLSPECIKDLYINILSKNNDYVTEKVSEEFSNYLTNYLNQLNEDGIYVLIESCSKNKQFLLKIFNNIEKFVISENDFYNKKESANLKLYKLFLSNGYNKDSSFSKTKYFKSSNEFTKYFLSKLENLQIPYLKIMNIIENNLFLQNLRLIFGNEEKINNLFEIFLQYFEICKSKFFQLNEIINYLSIFEEKENRTIIELITNIIQELKLVFFL